MSDYGPISLERTSAGWLLKINGFTEESAVGAYIWPGGVPHGVTITAGLVITEPHPSGDFTIAGVTMDALQTMDPWWSSYFSQASVMSADEPAPEHPHPAGSSGAGPLPGADEHERAERLKEHILDGAHGVFTVGEIVGMFAEEESAVALVGEVAGGFGDVLAVAVVLYATWHAFGEGLRDEENRGAMFGLVWQVIGHPDQEPQYNEDDTFAKLPWDSFEEMTKAFHDGVSTGRGMAGDAKTHNRVAAAIAWIMYQNGYDENTAASLVLNEIWQQATGGSKHQFVDFP
jgi:hypothetical protein